MQGDEVCITALTNCCVVLTGYHDQHQVIQWFWQAIEKFDNERRLRLLQVDYDITAVRDSVYSFENTSGVSRSNKI